MITSDIYRDPQGQPLTAPDGLQFQVDLATQGQPVPWDELGGGLKRLGGGVMDAAASVAGLPLAIGNMLNLTPTMSALTGTDKPEKPKKIARSLDDNIMMTVKQAVDRGALPDDPSRFLSMIGEDGKSYGITPSEELGVLGRLAADKTGVFPDRKKLEQRQNAILQYAQAYSGLKLHAESAMLQQQALLNQYGPKTTGEAEQLGASPRPDLVPYAPGQTPLTPGQSLMAFDEAKMNLKPRPDLVTPDQIVQDARLQHAMGNLDPRTLQSIESSITNGLLPAPQPAANVRAGFTEVAKRQADQQSVQRDKAKYEKSVAEGQAQFAALPTVQQTPQSAARIARQVQTTTGILPNADDIIKASKNPNQPLVTIDNRQENATAKKIGEGLGEEYVGLQKSAVSASQQLSKLDRMEQLLQGMETGKLTPAMTQIQALGESLGFQVDPSLPAKQALEALSNEIALTLRNPAGGAGMPGAMSDKDREFLMSMTPGLARTTEGNRLIITTAKRIAKRSQEVAKMARSYKQKHGGNFDDGFFDELQAFSDKNPLFTGMTTPQPTAPAQKPGWSIKPVP